jgi:hypothetical protein
MPQYYNPGLFPATYANPYMMQNSYSAPMQQPSTFMYTVDGEQAARAWQMPAGVAPGTVIPLFDVDGEHVYFKSTDAYGRLNPLRKGRVVLEEVPQLPQGASGDAPAQDMSQFVTKDDLNELKKELRNMMAPRNNQNGNNRGENK